MSILVKPTIAPSPKTKDVQKISIAYAGILVVLAVAQLFTFDEFLELFASFNFPGGGQTGYSLAAIIVFAEVFAIPFLLRMYLSSAFRVVSMMLGWITAALWLSVSLWVVINDPSTPNLGLLGTAVETMPGWWAVLVSFALGLLSAWASWGMWPIKNVHSAKKHSK